MATAEAYSEWEDVGLSFTDAEVDAYDPGAVAQKAVDRLLTGVVVCARVRQLGPPKPTVWQKAQAKMVDCATWHCLVGGLDGLDREHVADLPTSSSAAGKALTVQAHGWIAEGAVGVLEGWRVSVEGELRQMVSIGRRKVSSRKVGKADRSKMNKVANALVRELQTIDKLLALESSMSA